MVISSHANPHLKIFAESQQCLALTSFEYNEPRVHLLGSWFQLCYCNHLCVSFGLYATGQLIFVKKMAVYMLPLMVSHISAAAVVTVPLGNASGLVTWKLLVAFFNLNLHHLHHSNVNSV